MSKVISELVWFCIASLSDWFSCHSFNQSDVKAKPIMACACTFSHAMCQLLVIASSFDWFTGLSPSFLIGKEITLVLVLRHSFENRSSSYLGSVALIRWPLFGMLAACAVFKL